MNFVFASSVIGGRVETSPAHPEVRYFARPEIAELARTRMLRGTHIELAMDDYESGRRLPIGILQIASASPLPT